MVDRIYRNGRSLNQDEVRISYVSWITRPDGTPCPIRFDVMKGGNQSVYFAETLGM